MGPGKYVSELEEDQDDCSDHCFETDVSGNWFVSLYHLTVEKYSCITSCLGGGRRTSFCSLNYCLRRQEYTHVHKEDDKCMEDMVMMKEKKIWKTTFQAILSP